jgi:hypothetical protein
VASASGLGWAFRGVLVGAAAILFGACLRFVIAPTRERANLRPFAELYGLAANVGLAVALAVTRGVRLF